MGTMLCVIVLGIVSAFAQVSYSVEQRRDMVMQPAYLANWVGADFFTRSSIEKDLSISPVTFQKGIVFYDLPKATVGLKFMGVKNVCVEFSFWLFGTEALDFKDNLVKYGYTLKSEKEMIITDEGGSSKGILQVYKFRLRDGYSTCEVLSGLYTSFTFYRSQK